MPGTYDIMSVEPSFSTSTPNKTLSVVFFIKPQHCAQETLKSSNLDTQSVEVTATYLRCHNENEL